MYPRIATQLLRTVNGWILKRRTIPWSFPPRSLPQDRKLHTFDAISTSPRCLLYRGSFTKLDCWWCSPRATPVHDTQPSWRTTTKGKFLIVRELLRSPPERNSKPAERYKLVCSARHQGEEGKTEALTLMICLYRGPLRP